MPAPQPRSDDENRDDLERYMQMFVGHVTLLTQRMAAGEIGVSEWRLLLEAEIRMLHATALLIARGGMAYLQPRDPITVERLVSVQLTYLDMFAHAISPPTPFSSALAEARARMYAGAALATYYRVYADSLGLPELPRYPGDGSTACLSRCRCRLRIDALGDGDFDVWWVIDALAEHCPDCVELTRTWSPLRVRGGVVLGV